MAPRLDQCFDTATAVAKAQHPARLGNWGLLESILALKGADLNGLWDPNRNPQPRKGNT